jgi:hypothetical protein
MPGFSHGPNWTSPTAGVVYSSLVLYEAPTPASGACERLDLQVGDLYPRELGHAIRRFKEWPTSSSSNRIFYSGGSHGRTRT